MTRCHQYSSEYFWHCESHHPSQDWRGHRQGRELGGSNISGTSLEEQQAKKFSKFFINLYLVIARAPVYWAEYSRLRGNPLQKIGRGLIGITRALENLIQALEICLTLVEPSLGLFADEHPMNAMSHGRFAFSYDSSLQESFNFLIGCCSYLYMHISVSFHICWS